MVKYKDIADYCEVSVATVSYVLNNKGSISSDVRNKIIDAAGTLGYKTKAGQAKSQKTIRLFCADLETLPTHLFFNELLAGMFSVTITKGYDVIVTPALKDNKGNSQIKIESKAQEDGILIINPRDNEDFLQDVKAAGIPLVVIGRPGTECEDISYVDADNEAVGYNMTKHLLEQGHRSILFVNGPEDYTISQDRLNGYKMALTDYNTSFDPNLVVNSEFTVDCAEKVVLTYLETFKKTAAVVANSDALTIGTLNALNKKGIKVPDDCSIICGGESALAKMYHIPITGVDLHHDRLGSSAAELLINLIEKNLIKPTHFHVPFDLNDRGSTRRK